MLDKMSATVPAKTIFSRAIRQGRRREDVREHQGGGEDRGDAREEARQAAREAKRAAKEAARQAEIERKALIKQGRRQFKYKVTAYKRKAEAMRKHIRLPKDEAVWTPEQREQWNAYILTSRKELEDWLVERMRKELSRAPKSIKGNGQSQPPPAEVVARREAKEKRRQEIFEKYGFRLGKKPVTPDEIEGFKRWHRDQAAEYRERHREHITAYNQPRIPSPEASGGA